jgi:hypothetical protein
VEKLHNVGHIGVYPVLIYMQADDPRGRLKQSDPSQFLTVTSEAASIPHHSDPTLESRDSVHQLITISCFTLANCLSLLIEQGRTLVFKRDHSFIVRGQLVFSSRNSPFPPPKPQILQV